MDLSNSPSPGHHLSYEQSAQQFNRIPIRASSASHPAGTRSPRQIDIVAAGASTSGPLSKFPKVNRRSFA